MNKENKEVRPLGELREEIDRVDRTLVSLFAERMTLSRAVADYKRAVGMAVTDKTREAALLDRVAALSPSDLADYTRTLYGNILSLSRAYQHKMLDRDAPLTTEIKKTVAVNAPFPTNATVACQGVAGAYSAKAAAALFPTPDISYCAKFADVFAAIESGKCRYGVLPIENSTAGSVTEIYDLMAKHRFYIVRAIRLPVEHCLLAQSGTKIEELKEIVSHPQALAQCGAFLAAHPEVKVTPMPNTALAAQHAAANRQVAAIASRDCAALYGLSVLAGEICDTKNNCTRFICISKNLEIYGGADKTSLILTAAHEPGSLAKLLSRFEALQINLTKLESRPIPERSFEFRFYFDLVSPASSPALLQLLAELAGEHEDFRYLGTYAELE